MGYKVYRLTFPDGRVYVGMTSKNLIKRFGDGLGYIHNCGERMPVAKAIAWFGWRNVRISVEAEFDEREKAEEKEKSLISELHACELDKGFNVQTGGKSGCTFNSAFIKSVSGVRRSPDTEFKPGHECHTLHPFMCLENGRKYASRPEAEADLGVKLGHVAEVCKGKRKKCGGYTFRYL